MVRLSRAQSQERNRARVLAAAREEFAERGFAQAKVDAIAERAGLTRGAVYSNFTGKRALYFTVLAEDAERAEAAAPAEPGATPHAALGALARAWLARLPLATGDRGAAARLSADLVPEVLVDDRVARPYAQLTKVSAVLLGLALERLDPSTAPGARLVRVAESALTVLHGAGRLAWAAPGFVEPFNVVAACERMAEMDLGDRWTGPPIVPPARPADDPWSPPPVLDLLTGETARPGGEGVVAVLGLHRLSALEDAVRAAPPGAEVTVAAVTGEPAELAPLVRLALAELRGCLRQAVPASAWPRVRIVCDASGTLAAAAGVPAVSDATETAVRLRGGRVTARAEGYGAGHAAAAGAAEPTDRAG
ncbi:TetR/AcrR family transcriptional regulator [Allonocardiopsis opalescens]|uniref:TetR family transcriptional regulator n=1 Tax=Allonocardiopsis opalescens TaxID=1144618 RepID=A0A2T0Q244_9ACTN|nr:TetR/AcrR family transcriptional regulator [Allonocardiopsis opalescens]PRX97748.1 TetR family transcriptional regulator [Allonocardiopsis opalescens]